MNTLLPQATRDLIQQYLDATPQYLQDTLLRIDWTSELARIGAKHRLGHEQITNLTVETAMTLFGISEPQLFHSNIMNHIGVSSDIAASITTDVAERIFDRMQQIIHDEYGDQIMALQDELVQLEAEEDMDNNVLKEIGIDIGNNSTDDKSENETISWDAGMKGKTSESSLSDKKMSGTFSLDTNEPRAVHYPNADPYHEDFMIDVVAESIRHQPPKPPTAPGTAAQKAVPNMLVPPMPPAPPKN
jgi:hypothetical protein